MIPAPGDAPARPDLDWLRHRTRRGAPADAAQPAPAATTAGGGLADFLAGRTTRRQPAPAPGVQFPGSNSTDGPRQLHTREVPSPAVQPGSADPLDLGTSAADPLDLSGPPSAQPTPPSAQPSNRPTPPPVPPPSTAPSGGDLLDLSAPSPQPAPPTPAPAVPPGGDLLDLSAPGPPPATRPSGDLDLGSSDLDLSEPAPLPPPASRPTADLDLSGPSPAPAQPVPAPSAPAPPVSSSLDLFPEAPAAPPAGTPVARPRPVARPVPRVPAGGRVILTPREPTVTLDRVQSGVGALRITAVCSPAVGDLVLGAVYQLADGSSGVVSRTAGVPTAPPRSRRPVLEAGRDEHDRIRVDLRQTRSLRRFVVHAMSASEGQLAWGGTLVLTTHGGSRVEIPLDLAPHAGPVVLASVHVVDGEFVVRAELEPVHGLVRDVALAHGFRAITWADARTPVL